MTWRVFLWCRWCMNTGAWQQGKKCWRFRMKDYAWGICIFSRGDGVGYLRGKWKACQWFHYSALKITYKCSFKKIIIIIICVCKSYYIAYSLCFFMFWLKDKIHILRESTWAQSLHLTHTHTHTYTQSITLHELWILLALCLWSPFVYFPFI